MQTVYIEPFIKPNTGPFRTKASHWSAKRRDSAVSSMIRADMMTKREPNKAKLAKLTLWI
ncbi:hypothetical protein D3C76_1352860 [compost metagenome]